MVELRPYQEEALREIVAAVRIRRNLLLQAATGAGKTVLMAELIKRFLCDYPKMRILLMAHRETLVRQAMDKLTQWWPEASLQMGVVCASVERKPEYDRRVLIGSVQTLARRLDNLPAIHMLLVDEVHRMPPKNLPSQYRQVVESLQTRYGDLRLLGVTATPFRLGHGYIYGDKCRSPEGNWFEELTYSVGIEELQNQGYLCPLEAYGVDTPDLSGVSTSKGEFALDELSDLMSQGVHLDSAVKAWEKYAADRKHTVVFGVTIEHAELLKEAFERAGHESTIVHSKLSHDENLANLEAFNSGRVPFIVNVGVLTEGWDCPVADCIVLCRPTKSAALWVQMVGRGLRTAPGKENCLLLDMSGNWRELGSPAHPKVTWKNGGEEGPEFVYCPECRRPNRKTRFRCEFCAAVLNPEDEGQEPCACVNCGWEVSPKAILCPRCGARLKATVDTCPQMTKLEVEQDTEEQQAIIHGRPRLDFDFVSKKGTTILKISMDVIPDGGQFPITVNEYLNFEGNDYYSVKFTARKWLQLANNPVPKTLAEAKLRQDELVFPERVTICRRKGWWNVVRWSA